MQSIKDIKLLFDNAGREQWEQLFVDFASDQRAGVQKVIEQHKKKQIAYEKEMPRLEKML